MILTTKTVKHLEVLAILLLVVIGAFLRLYRFRETLMFQGDQGRDALVVKQMIKDGKLTLLGPVTSVGNMYLGPFYYYFMVPFLAITYPDPIGPAYAVALMNIISLGFIYLIGKEMFGKMAGWLSLFIYVFMIPAIIISRFSWNPNLAPTVSMLLVWALFRFWSKKQYAKFLWVGLTLGILAQLHYMAMIMLGVVLVIFVIGISQNWKDRFKIIEVGIGAVIIFGLTWLPLLIFNARHDNLILNAFTTFLTGGEQRLNLNQLMHQTIALFEGNIYRILAQLLLVPDWLSRRLVVYGGIMMVSGLIWYRKVKVWQNDGLMIILITLGLTVIGVSIYQGSVFDHYLGFIFPVIALFWGFILSLIYRLAPPWGSILVIFVLGFYLVWSLPKSPSFGKPGPLIDNYQRVANDIAAQIGTGKYNLALLSESKDYKGMNYRYFLNVSHFPTANIDDYSNLSKLVIVDELRVADPLKVQIYEIQQPQMDRLVNVFEIPQIARVYIYEK
jgi:4-amino-4-deoxy-L-arabinose transferase-like glycosyltransferase